MIVQVVRFESGLTDEEVLATYESRTSRYRALPGLAQKYYLRFPATDEHGAVYVWESESAMKEFRDSELGRTIRQAYAVHGEPDVRVGEVVMTLRRGAGPER